MGAHATDAVPSEETRAFARAVLLGLSESPRWLPCQYLYDARGSELFEQITELPEYYPTRTEVGILERAAPEIAAITGPVSLIELGSGSSTKTELLLSAYAEAKRDLHYVPVDVSGAALAAAHDRIEAAHPQVHVHPIVGPYQDAFPRFREYSPCMVAFLGSTLGNFNQGESAAFWTRVTQALAPGDYFLLGADLVKDPAVLDAAYNDAAGVTAEFTKNLFVRMNRELGAGLDVEGIEHEARYSETWQRVEIFARFARAQTVTIAPLGARIPIPEGERVMVEISRKFLLPDLMRYLGAFGLESRRVFTDPDEWFALLLIQRQQGA